MFLEIDKSIDIVFFSESSDETFFVKIDAFVGLAKPGKLGEEATDLSLKELLHNRRAGIEPLIVHTKRGGQLGKSRMKSDAATLAAGYGSVLGFNLRQVDRYQQGKIKTAA